MHRTWRSTRTTTQRLLHLRSACEMASFFTDSLQQDLGRPAGPLRTRGAGPARLQGIITQWFSMPLPPRSSPPQTASLGYALISRLTTNRHREAFALLPR